MRLHGGRERAPEFILLTGTLGSGKTTLLSDYLALPESAETGVIVNDAGEINIDGAVVAAGRSELPMRLLGNGCVCCSLGNDLHTAIDDLLAIRRQAGQAMFHRIILETSGIALPGPIVRSLMTYDRADYQIRIVSTLDPLHQAAADPLASIRAAQLTAATTIVITKTDIAGAQRIADAIAAATALNPTTRPIDLRDRRARAASAFRSKPAERSASATRFNAIGSSGHTGLQVCLADWPGGASWNDIRDWLEDLAGFCGDRLLRTKGFLSLEGSIDPVLIESVGTAFATPRRVPCAAPPRTGLVIIVHDVAFAELQQFSSQSLGANKPTLTLSRVPPS